MADDESTRIRRRRNWKRGMFRLWAVCAVGWIEAEKRWADARDPLANAVRVEDETYTLDPPLPQAEISIILERARRKELYGRLVQSGSRLLIPPLLVLAGGVGLWWTVSWVTTGFRKDT